MTPKDASYFMLRAEQERNRAETCCDPAVAAAHRALSKRYVKLVDEADAISAKPLESHV